MLALVNPTPVLVTLILCTAAVILGIGITFMCTHMFLLEKGRLATHKDRKADRIRADSQTISTHIEKMAAIQVEQTRADALKQHRMNEAIYGITLDPGEEVVSLPPNSQTRNPRSSA